MLLGAQVGRAAHGAGSLEEGADRIVRELFQSFWDLRSNSSELALVRFYRTIAFSDLAPELQEVARAGFLPANPSPASKCLTLMASAGVEPAWNSRHTSKGHRAIALASRAAIEAMPMVSRLMKDLGARVDGVVEDKTIPSGQGSDRRILYIEAAAGCGDVPDQESFVRPYGIESVLGVGGTLRSGDFWALIVFTRVPLRSEKAELLKVLSSDIKIALLPVLTNRLFAA